MYVSKYVRVYGCMWAHMHTYIQLCMDSLTQLIFYLLVDKLLQPNMAASSGLSGKIFSLQSWNF